MLVKCSGVQGKKEPGPFSVSQYCNRERHGLPFQAQDFETSGLKWCAGLEGTIAFHAAVFASVGPWETDWNKVLEEINDCLRLELKKDLKPDKIEKWMFDDDFERGSWSSSCSNS